MFYRDAAVPPSPLELHHQSGPVTGVDHTNEGLSFLNTNGRTSPRVGPSRWNSATPSMPSAPMNVDLTDRASALPALSTLPLTEIPIPMTHDSGSYGTHHRVSPWALRPPRASSAFHRAFGFLQT